MQDNIMETTIQPFVKLAQSNFELIKQLCQPFEASSSGKGINPLLQGPASWAQMIQSGVLMQLMQDAMKNYTEFLMALNQNTMIAVGQTRTNVAREGQALVERAAEVATTPTQQHRRVPQEA